MKFFRRPVFARSRATPRILAEAAELMQRRQYRAAIDALTDANRRAADPRLEAQLVQTRHAAFAAVDAPPPGDWPPQFADPFPQQVGIPEVAASDLSAPILGGALQHHGSLIVRGLATAAQAAVLVEDIDHALAAYDADVAGGPPAEQGRWFTRFAPGEGYAYTELERRWGRQSGGQLLVADSPRALFDVVETFTSIGFGRLLAEYLGEWPALSFKKSTLRRTPPTSETEWHQDGAFLGAATRTVNAWLACTPCGIDAPSLDVVARRLDGVVETGTAGSAFSWSVAPAVAQRVAGNDIVRPVFAAGDALLLDQLTLHRTGVGPGMSRTRYALESWFFAPSTYPHDQVPIVF
jgi:hypothetical protein